jgi:hypothetical protein
MVQTSRQIIEQGEYLQLGFNPDTLSKPQIRGILINHGCYKSTEKRNELIQQFIDCITRCEAENAAPSSDGISNGITGEPVEPSTNIHAQRRIYIPPSNLLRCGKGGLVSSLSIESYL